MPGSAIAALNAAMYAKATADAELSNLATGIFQFVPEKQPFPYIEFGMGIETPDNAHDSFGSLTTVIWHAWDTSRNLDVVHNIASRLIAIFDHQPLTITGHRRVALRFEQALTVTDPDPAIRHVTVRFKVNTQQE